MAEKNVAVSPLKRSPQTDNDEFVDDTLEILAQDEKPQSTENGRNPMTQASKTDRKGRNPWSKAEEKNLMIAVYEKKRLKDAAGGDQNIGDDEDEVWEDIASKMPGRSAVQCLLRFTKIKEEERSDNESSDGQERRVSNGWTEHEEKKLIEHMQDSINPGFNSTEIYSVFPGRSEDEIKSKWKSLSSSLLASSISEDQSGKKKRNYPDELAEEEEKISSPAKKVRSDDGSWTEKEVEQLKKLVEQCHDSSPLWDEISTHFINRSPIECLSQWQKISKPAQIKGKGSWTPEEDRILREKRALYGRKWSKIASFLPGRQGKQCRERFVNHLDPDLKKGEWTDDEEAILIGMHEHHGNKWTVISKHLPGRSDNDVKNHWYATIQRKFAQHGRKKLTTAAIQQVFMLVHAGLINPQVCEGWPDAPPLDLRMFNGARAPGVYPYVSPPPPYSMIPPRTLQGVEAPPPPHPYSRSGASPGTPGYQYTPPPYGYGAPPMLPPGHGYNSYPTHGNHPIPPYPLVPVPVQTAPSQAPPNQTGPPSSEVKFGENEITDENEKEEKES